MDTKEIFSAVGNFGFPMVLSWYLLLRMEQRLDKLTSCLNELSRAIHHQQTQRTVKQTEKRGTTSIANTQSSCTGYAFWLTS